MYVNIVQRSHLAVKTEVKVQRFLLIKNFAKIKNIKNAFFMILVKKRE